MLHLLIAGAILAAVAATYLAALMLAERVRKRCPQCRVKGLKRINYLRCNPPPNISFHACDRCGGEFVQVSRFKGVESPMVAREGSPWEHSWGWDTPGGERASPVG